MKNKILKILFLNFCVFASAIAVFSQDEASYQKALAEAYSQSNPSEHRAQALKKLLDAPENKRMSEKRLNEFVAAKFKELMETDFYAAFLAQSMPAAEIVKWREVFELLPAEQVAALKKLNQWKTSGASKAAYPQGVPQAGYGWGKTVSSNVRPKNSPAINATQTKTATANSAAAPTSPVDALIAGIRQSDEKDYEAAIRSFSECIRLDPQAAGCYSQRGLTYSKKANYVAAVADFDEAIRLEPQRDQLYVNRGLAYIKQEKHDLAIADFEAALKINPNYEEVKAALKSAREYVAAKKNYAAAEETRSKSADDYLRQGTEQFKLKKWNEAIALYTLCIKADPLNLNCYNNRGLSYGAVNEYDKAIADFSVILVIKQLPKIYFQRALAYRDKGDLEAALKDLSDAVRLAPDDPENYAERGGTYIYKKDYASATVDLTQAIKLNSQEARYYFIRGYAYQSAGNKDSAIADYKKALQINPNFAAARDQLQTLGVEP